MRRIVLVSVLVLLLVPAVAVAKRLAPGDGTLSVESGRGLVVVQARGAIVGRVDRGVVQVVDQTPFDDYEPSVRGADDERTVGRVTVYRGDKLRFNVIGGGFRVTVRGTGIDLSAVGRGAVLLQADAKVANPGLYSLDGDDCRFAPASCTPLPDRATRMPLGGPARERERDAERPSPSRVVP